VIFDKLLDGLRASGWKESDLKAYDSIETLLNSKNMPKNPIDVKKMVESLESITVQNPKHLAFFCLPAPVQRNITCGLQAAPFQKG
jgi:hypothetical protein